MSQRISLRLVDQPCHALYTTVNAIIRAYRPLLEPLELTYPQYVVMLALWERDGISLRELSKATKLDSATLTPVIRRLAGRGLLTRERDPGDERRLVVALTADGRALRKLAETIPEEMLCAVGIDDTEAAELMRVSAAIRASLGA